MTVSNEMILHYEIYIVGMMDKLLEEIALLYDYKQSDYPKLKEKNLTYVNNRVDKIKNFFKKLIILDSKNGLSNVFYTLYYTNLEHLFHILENLEQERFVTVNIVNHSIKKILRRTKIAMLHEQFSEDSSILSI